MHACMHSYVSVCVCVCMYIDAYAHLYLHVYAHTHTYTHTHTHTHTHDKNTKYCLPPTLVQPTDGRRASMCLGLERARERGSESERRREPARVCEYVPRTLLQYVCPHTTRYATRCMSSYYYMCCYVCPHTTIYATICVSSYDYTCY